MWVLNGNGSTAASLLRACFHLLIQSRTWINKWQIAFVTFPALRVLVDVRSPLLPAGEGDDRGWWQARAFIQRMGGDLANFWQLPNSLSPLATNGARPQWAGNSIHRSGFCLTGTSWTFCERALVPVCFVLVSKLLDFNFFFRWSYAAWASARCLTCEVPFQKWLIRVLELGRWSRKQIFLWSLSAMFSHLCVQRERDDTPKLARCLCNCRPEYLLWRRLQKRHMVETFVLYFPL